MQDCCDDEPQCTCISIQFRFIRDNDNSQKDEVFSILQGTHSDLKAVYRSYVNQSKTTTYFKKGVEVCTYFRQVVGLMLIDDDKYSHFQLDAPGYPTLMLKFSQLRDEKIINRLDSIIEAVTDNWPIYSESI